MPFKKKCVANTAQILQINVQKCLFQKNKPAGAQAQELNISNSICKSLGTQFLRRAEIF